MERNKLDPGDGFDLEKSVSDNLALQKWGKDAPWYLPESLVGDIPYRYQGVGLHGLAGLSLMPFAPLLGLANLGYATGTIALGRTQRPKIGEKGVPVLKDQPY